MISNIKTKIFLFSFSLYVVMGLNRNLIGPLIPLISKDLNLGLDMVGFAISLSAFGLLIAGLATSLIIKLIGFKNTIFLGLVIMIASSLGFYFSYSFILFLISNIFLGLGSGILSVSIMSLIANSYSKDKTNHLFKITIGFSVGLMFAPFFISGILYSNVDWRDVFIIMLIAQVLLIIYLFFLKLPNYRVNGTFKSFLSINKKIITNKFFILCLIIIFIHEAVTNTFITWFTSYYGSLNIKLNISLLFMGVYLLATLMGMILKYFLVKIIDEKRLLLIVSIISFFSLFSAFLIDNLLIKNILIFIFGLNIAGTFTLTFSLGTMIDPVNTDSISGFAHSSQYLAIIIFQYLVGITSEYYSTESVMYINILLLFMLVIIVIIFNQSTYETIN